jgi:hypothetical protein
MDIIVRFQNGEWRVRPDPAEVRVGEPITWIVQAERIALRRLRWIVYFDAGGPVFMQPWMAFATGSSASASLPRVRLSVITLNTGFSALLERGFDLKWLVRDVRIEGEPILDHQGATEPLTPDRPGDYKYGVRVEDAESGEIVGDDDPLLIVRP